MLELSYYKLCQRVFGEKEEIPVKLLKPRPDGKFKGSMFNIEKLLQTVSRYYELMGIDPETQLPATKELERLGMKDVADMLEKLKEKPVTVGVAPEEQA